MNRIAEGLQKGLIKFDEEQKVITYVHQNKKRNYQNPEEKVQAETFLKLIIDYGYASKQIRQFVSVKMGADTKEADIIVYDDEKCVQPYILVECKKEDISELEFQGAIRQAESYAIAEGAKYIWTTSGIKDEYHELPKERPKAKRSIPDIPSKGTTELARYKYVKGGHDPQKTKQKFFELEIVSEDELTRRFKLAHNSLWQAGKMDPADAFDEFDKLIFCKMWDEQAVRKQGEPYQFQFFAAIIPPNATDKQREEAEEKALIDLEERIKALYEEGKKKDPQVFQDDIRLSKEKLRTVVGYLEGVNLWKTDLDSKGRAFETFMGAFFRGDFGQFFTPRKVVKFIVDVLDIKNESRVLDTSCGSGGFLLYALDKVRQQANEFYPNYKTDPDEREAWKKYWHDFAEKKLYGIELSEKIARTAKMNMIIHDDGHTNVINEDGLLLPSVIEERTGNKGFQYNSFDFIITNPPFGSTIKQTEAAYLKNFKTGWKDVTWLDTKGSSTTQRATQSTEVLFLEQCYYFLKPKGYLAMVIPDGILTNSSLQDIRNRLEEWYRIVAVVSLPGDAFAHFGAGVKSSVIFLRKNSNQRLDDIQDRKSKLQTDIKTEYNYETEAAKIEKEKANILKNHIGFVNHTGETEKKKIEATEAFKEWKSEISATYNERLNDLKEQLEEEYLTRKQKTLHDYPIFMAIAEKIGYDATGKPIATNELEFIGAELKRFINHINKTEK